MKTTISICAFLLCCFDAFTQEMGNYQSQVRVRTVDFGQMSAPIQVENQMELTIKALSNQKASSYVAIFSLMQLGRTADSTDLMMNQRLDGFIADLNKMGITAADIHVDMVNFLPKYQYNSSKKLFSKKTYTEIPIGFELQKNVHIRYRDQAILSKIVTAAAKQEIYDIVKVDYFLDNTQDIYDELRKTTIDYIADIKKRYSALMPMDSAYTIVAEKNGVAYPINRYESYRAFSSQKLDYEENSKVVEAEKPLSRFYNAVPANDYDIVINPEILEPAVQFSLVTTIRFILPERKPKIEKQREKEFILVTPDGVTRTLKVE